jgi:hypothetical protein
MIQRFNIELTFKDDVHQDVYEIPSIDYGFDSEIGQWCFDGLQLNVTQLVAVLHTLHLAGIRQIFCRRNFLN